MGCVRSTFAVALICALGAVAANGASADVPALVPAPREMAVTDGAFSPYVVDSLQTGPVRKVKDRVYPPVAYTGDDWVRNSSAASTLSFVSPSGGETSFNLTGTGTTQFNFGQSGRWTVSLVMADGTTQEAIVGVPGGFIITFY